VCSKEDAGSPGGTGDYVFSIANFLVFNVWLFKTWSPGQRGGQHAIFIESDRDGLIKCHITQTNATT
jgi:hypothetical protein